MMFHISSNLCRSDYPSTEGSLHSTSEAFSRSSKKRKIEGAEDDSNHKSRRTDLRKRPSVDAEQDPLVDFPGNLRAFNHDYKIMQEPTRNRLSVASTKAAGKASSEISDAAIDFPIASSLLEELRESYCIGNPAQQSAEGTVRIYNLHRARLRIFPSGDMRGDQPSEQSPSPTDIIIGYETSSEKRRGYARPCGSEAEPAKHYQDDEGLHEWLAVVALGDTNQGKDEDSETASSRAPRLDRY